MGIEICDKCGKPLGPYDRFCMACGKAIQRGNKVESIASVMDSQKTDGEPERPKAYKKLIEQLFTNLPQVIKIAAISAIIILPLLFGWFVWPTPWKSYRDGNVILKQNRFTGSLCMFYLNPYQGNEHYFYTEVEGDCW